MFEIDRTELIREGIRKAYEELNARTITNEETHSKYVFYFKNEAIWCKLVDTKTGEVWNDNRVYKVATDKPYIRDLGYYWYLGDREKAIIRRMLGTAV